MEKLRKMEPKKLALITALIVAVLGAIGVLFSGQMMVVGIIVVVLQVAIVFFIFCIPYP